jgi:hypothetical protein
MQRSKPGCELSLPDNAPLRLLEYNEPVVWQQRVSDIWSIEQWPSDAEQLYSSDHLLKHSGQCHIGHTEL